MSLEFIFLSFEKGVKGYRLWDPKNKKKVLSRDVVFDELTTSRTEANYLKKKNVNSAEIVACYALLASEGNPSCFQEAIESNE